MDVVGAIKSLSRGRRWVRTAAVAVVVAVVGAIGMNAATRSQFSDVARVPGVADVLSPSSQNVENFLLVGSDSRAGAEPSDPDFSAIGSEKDHLGKRSDSIIIVRFDKKSHGVSLFSVPRDLWVRIGTGNSRNRVNTAYSKGPAVLVRTIQRALNIPIHHYLEVDFQGFKSIVDDLGGVRICVRTPARDTHSHLLITKKGCHTLDGVQSLAYARSRYFETFANGVWTRDGSSDFGRTKRQRQFITAMVRASIARVKANPLSANSVLGAYAKSLLADDKVDLLDTAQKLQGLGNRSTRSYSLDVVNDKVGNASVLRLSEASAPLLAYFAGTGPAPEVK